MSVTSAIEGVSRLFQWLYTGVISVWGTFSVIVILLIFVGIQVAFIYIYIKVIALVLIIQPKINELIYRIDRFFS